MSDVTRAKHGRPVHHWRRDIVELAALFTAVAVADGVANLIGHGPDGPALLVISAVLLVATAGFHTWWARHHGHAPPTSDTGARSPSDGDATHVRSYTLPDADNIDFTLSGELWHRPRDQPGRVRGESSMNAQGVEAPGDFMGFVTDLGSIGALRSTWDRHSSDSIIATLAAALLRMLDLRFVFVRLHDTTRNLPRDFLRVDSRYPIGNDDITVALQPWLSGPKAAGQRLDYPPLGAPALSITVLELGSSSLGRLIVGAARDRFPGELEDLLLRATANEAYVALLEQSIAKAQQELAHAARVLSIGELTASLAHEINQPLAAIVANAHASRRWLDRKVPNYKLAQSSLESIVRDGNRASAIIQRVRSFSAKALPSQDRLDVNDVIREVVALAAHEIAREQVGLRTDRKSVV